LKTIACCYLSSCRTQCKIFVVVVACSIFILLSRESDGGAIFWTNAQSSLA